MGGVSGQPSSPGNSSAARFDARQDVPGHFEHGLVRRVTLVETTEGTVALASRTEAEEVGSRVIPRSIG
ncbi:MAG: hypothetical protein U9R47_04910, partial [Actinomycetota bacterium]|nr:hypothetical protein [Actinomycetota bacterium]